MTVKNRTFVIGDIHGTNKALIQCLERVNFDYENDTLISLGDIADGYKETAQCVETLLKIKNLITIRGNHDCWVYDWFNKGYKPSIWLNQGGLATIESYINTDLRNDERHKEFWLHKQKNWYIDNNKRLFIHGGWDYMLSKDFFIASSNLLPNISTKAMSCHWDRSLFSATISAKNRNTHFKELDRFKEIYIGHTALENNIPFNYQNLWNLDTDAGYKGKLTIMNVDTKEYKQSDLVTELYK